MSDKNIKLIKAILHYQQNLERYSARNEEAKMLHCIDRLQNLPITVSHLEETGIGRTVNSMRKLAGVVGDAARTLVNKWKGMVEEDDVEDNDNYKESNNLVERQHKEKSEKHRQGSSHNEKVKKSNSSSSSSDEKEVKPYEDRNNREERESKKDREDKEYKREHRDNKREDREYNRKSKKEDKEFKREDKDKRDEKEYKRDKSEYKKEDKNNKAVEKEYKKEDKCYKKEDKDYKKDKRDHKKEEKRKHKHNESKGKKSDESSSDELEDKEKRYNKNKEKSKHKHTESKRKKSDESSSDEPEERKKKKYTSDDSDDDDKTEQKYKTNGKHHSKRRYSSSEAESETRNSSDESDSENENDKHRKESKHSDENSENEKEKHRRKSKHLDESNSHKSNKEKKSDDYKSHKKKYETETKLNGTKYEEKSHSSKSNASSSKKDSSKSEKSHKSSKSDKSDKSEKNNKSDKPKDSKKSKKESSSNSPLSKKKKVSINDGIDCGSGASFAEALGMLLPTTSKVKTAKKLAPSTPEKVSKKTPEINPPLLAQPLKLEPLDINISSLLPSISTNYKPLGNNVVDLQNAKNKIITDDEALTKLMYSKNARTKVYSGNKCFWGVVPTLFELCIRVLQDNIDALEATGGVPYSILKPVLDKATPDQLFMLEHHNPYIIEDSDELWNFHCQKEFRNKKREELETWREMYMRCLDEREAKLKALTANIKLSQDKSIPVRQTKLAYVDSVVKPPRNIAKKQLKNGIELNLKKPAVTPSSRLSALASAGAAGQPSVPNPGRPSGGSSAPLKQKKAPLMQKTLQLMKGRFRR